MGRGELILAEAVRLFSEHGYENTTIRDIATAASTVPAEIYDYYPGKDAMLEAIYKRYGEVMLAERPTPERYIPILKAGTAEEILDIFNYPLPEPQELNFRIVRIVLSRKLADGRARDAYLNYSWREAKKYLNEVLTQGVELGRFDMSPQEVELFGHYVHAVRDYSACMATAIPEQDTWRETETKMNRSLASFLRLNEAREEAPADADRDEAPAVVAEATECESLSVGRYHHYASALRKMGEATLARFVDEIVDNLLGELDALYACTEQSAMGLDRDAIMRLIAGNEALKQQKADAAAAHLEGEAADIFSQIADLAQQHGRLCLSNLE